MDDKINFPLTRSVTLFGREIKAKNYICARDGGCYLEKPGTPKLQLSILPTNFCDLSCPFCSARSLGTLGNSRLDLGKLEPVLKELARLHMVGGVSITGGEPFTDITLLDDIISLCFDTLGESMEISINTNGSGLRDVHKIHRLHLVNAIHISRHHYDERVNAALFHGLKSPGQQANGVAGDIPTNAEIKEIVDSVPFKDLFVYNCLLMKDYIGSREEFHRFLDFAIETGVHKTGFITVMEVNDFTRQQRVSYQDIISRDDPQLLFTKCFEEFDFCCCQDGVYSSKNGGICEFYGRQTKPGSPGYVRGLVFGADNHLRTGYTGDVII